MFDRSAIIRDEARAITKHKFRLLTEVARRRRFEGPGEKQLEFDYD